MYKWIVIIGLFFLANCKKPETINPDSKVLKYVVFDNELKTKPLSDANGFSFIAIEKSEMAVLHIDTNGVKTRLYTIDNHDSISSYSIKLDTLFNLFTILVESDLYGNDTIEFAKIIKMNEKGNVLWQTAVPIINSDTIQFSYFDVLCTNDGGAVVIATAEVRNPQARKSYIKVIYVDEGGNIGESYTSQDMKENFVSQILRLDNGLFILLPSSFQRPGATNKITIFSQSLELVGEKPFDFLINEVQTILFSDKLLVFIGLQLDLQMNGVLKFGAVNADATKAWETTISEFFTVYSITRISTGYLLTGTKDSKSFSPAWNNIYQLNSGNSISWIVTDLVGNVVMPATNDFAGEYVSAGVAATLTNSGDYCILGIKKSFGNYNNIVFIKTKPN